MTPKEKANELVERFNVLQTFIAGCDYEYAKDCALIAVHEIIKYLNDILVPNPFGQYWQEVQKEIENL